jgi:AraC-like DNA-binding protein
VNSINDVFRYLPIGARTKQWGLYVTGCGHVEIPPQGQHPPSGHPECYGFSWKKGRVLPEYQVIYLIHGRGVFESTATGNREISSGDVITLFPGVWHRYRPHAGQGWQSYWIGINGWYVERLADQGFLQPADPIISVGDQGELLETYRRVTEIAMSEDLYDQSLLAAGAMEILGRVFAPIRHDPAEPATDAFSTIVTDRMVAEAIRFIWSDDKRDMTVDDVVATLPVSRRSLERRFQKALGRTVLEEITRCRIERAKRLLEETELPIKSVATTVGFSHAQRMTRVFRELVGQPPAAYRKMSRG